MSNIEIDKEKYLCNPDRPLYPYIERKYTVHIPLYHILNDKRPLDLFDNPDYKEFTMMSYSLYDSNLKNLLMGYFNSSDVKIDSSFFEKNQKFLENLTQKEKYMLSGYTFNGDVFLNLYLAGLTIPQKEKELEKYIMNYSPGPIYESFSSREYAITPLYYQLVKKIKEKKYFKKMSYDDEPDNSNENELLKKENKESIDMFIQLYGVNGPSVTDDINDWLDWTRLIEERERLEKESTKVDEKSMFLIDFKEDDSVENILENQSNIRDWFGDIKRDKYYVNLIKECIKEYCKELEKIFDKAPGIEKEMEVFRGVKNMYYKKENSDIYINNTFTSTTLNPVKTLEFVGNECCLKKIILKPGFKLICLEPITQVRGEFELCIPPNNEFRIISHEEFKPKNWNAQNFGYIKSYEDFYNYICNNEIIKYDKDIKRISNYQGKMTLTIMESIN